MESVLIFTNSEIGTVEVYRAYQIIRENFIRNVSQENVYGTTNYPQLIGNVWTSPSGVTIDFNDDDSYGGNIYRNNFSGPPYHFSVPGTLYWDDNGNGNFWNDYTGQDTDGDGIVDTDLPHWGVDFYPLMNRPASPFVFTHSNTIRMMSSVAGEDFKIRGTVKFAPLYGLRFGGSTALAEDGTLLCVQHLSNSDKWMNTPGNLDGCLVWWNASGKPAMCVSPDGVVRTSGSLMPKF